MPTTRAEAWETGTTRTPRGPGGAPIAAPPHWVSRRRRCLPRAELMTLPLTPYVAAREQPIPKAEPPLRRQVPPLPSPRQRQWGPRSQDAFPRRILPPPRPPLARLLAWPGWKVWDHRQAVTEPSVSPPWAGFRRLFTTQARSYVARPRYILPRACGSLGVHAGPSAARRLLQPVQPVSTTDGTSEPRYV